MRFQRYFISVGLGFLFSLTLLWIYAPQIHSTPLLAEITVTTTADDTTTNNNCTLREAIIAANTNTAVDSCPAGTAIDQLIIPAGHYVLSLTGFNENGGLTGDLDITDTLTIVGAGSAQTIIDAAGISDRVLHILAGTVVISGVTIQHGSAPGASAGGGISNSGVLTLTHSRVQYNQAQSGGGIITNNDLIVVETEILSNTSAGSGSAIFNNGTSEDLVRLSKVTVMYNNAPISIGGAIWNDQAMFIEDSTISYNNAFGLASATAILTVTNSTISHNTRGGIWNDGYTSVSNSTIVNNTAAMTAGGILSAFSGAGLPPLLLINTIVANNGNDNCDTLIASLGYNLDSDGSCGLTEISDRPNLNPRLGPLKDNGGPTPTHALLADSPAIDAGNNLICPAADQRGQPRPVDGDKNGSEICDIGAYEFVPPHPLLTISQTGRPNPVAAGEILTYTITFTNSGSGPATGVSLMDTLDDNVAFFTSDPPIDNQTQNQLYWTWPTALAPATRHMITVSVLVTSPLANGTLLTNNIFISSLEDVTAQATITTLVQSAPILQLSHSASPNLVSANDLLTYALVLTNIGNLSATNLYLTDTLDSYVTFQVVEPPFTGQDGQTLWWLWEELAPQMPQTITLVTQVAELPQNYPHLANMVEIRADQAIEVTSTITTAVYHVVIPPNFDFVYLPLVQK